jgi:hypothetical protein
MSDDGSERVGVHRRLRAVAERVVSRIGGVPAVQTLLATLAVYDRAGGGLVAGGLAYAALVALLPGLLLVLSVIGILVDDPAVREDIVELIGTAVPPLEELVRIALDAVSAGAVPTGILAFLGLLWGSSRFYAALDYAFARIFHNAPQRNEVVRTLRGLVVTVLFVVVPIAAVIVTSAATWIMDLAPDGETLGALERLFWKVASPLGSVVLFVGKYWSGSCRRACSCAGVSPPGGAGGARAGGLPSCSRSSRRSCSGHRGAARSWPRSSCSRGCRSRSTRCCSAGRTGSGGRPHNPMARRWIGGDRRGIRRLTSATTAAAAAAAEPGVRRQRQSAADARLRLQGRSLDANGCGRHRMAGVVPSTSWRRRPSAVASPGAAAAARPAWLERRDGSRQPAVGAAGHSGSGASSGATVSHGAGDGRGTGSGAGGCTGAGAGVGVGSRSRLDGGGGRTGQVGCSTWSTGDVSGGAPAATVSAAAATGSAATGSGSGARISTSAATGSASAATGSGSVARTASSRVAIAATPAAPMTAAMGVPFAGAGEPAPAAAAAAVAGSGSTPGCGLCATGSATGRLDGRDLVGLCRTQLLGRGIAS